MGRSPCSSNSLKKGPWSPEEDQILSEYIQNHGGHGSWRALPKRAGLNRCGKSCRLRWCNYLRPDIKRGNFTETEEEMIINLHSALGNKWSQIAGHLPGRTDNEIKNFWNTRIRKKLVSGGIDPKTHQPIFDANSFLVNISHLMMSNSNLTANLMSPLDNAILRLKAYLTQPSPNTQLLLNLWQLINSSPNAIPNTFQENTSLLQPSFNLSQCTGVSTGTSTSPNIQESISGLHNMQVNPQILSGNVDVMNALSFLGEESKPELLHSRTSSNITSRTSSVQSEDVLPALASTSTTPPTFGTNYQMDTTFFSTSSDLFDDWEKLIDDEEESGSFWKNLLISN